MASIEMKTCLGGPSLMSSVNRKADYPVGPGLIHGLSQITNYPAGSALSVVSLIRQTKLGGLGLISGVNRHED